MKNNGNNSLIIKLAYSIFTYLENIGLKVTRNKLFLIFRATIQTLKAIAHKSVDTIPLYVTGRRVSVWACQCRPGWGASTLAADNRQYSITVIVTNNKLGPNSLRCSRRSTERRLAWLAVVLKVFSEIQEIYIACLVQYLLLLALLIAST